MKTRNMKITGMLLAGVIIVVSFVYAINVQPIVIGDKTTWIKPYNNLKNFGSYEELTDFLAGHSHGGVSSFVYDRGEQEVNFFSNIATSGGKLVDYSQTNVQVTGVDEPDIVKTDGTYLYIVTGNRVLIVRATPAENATIECELSVNGTILNIFISGSRLVIFTQEYTYPVYDKPHISDNIIGIDLEYSSIICYSQPSTHVQIYELGDMKTPILVKDISVDGSFTGARLIEDYVYLVTFQYSWSIIYNGENSTFIPFIKINGERKTISLEDIGYIDFFEPSKTLTNIVSVNVHDDTKNVTAKVFILGDSQILYVSKNNIYISSYSTNYYDYNIQKQIIEEIIMPRLPESIRSEIEIVKTLSLDDYQKEQVIQWLVQNCTSQMTEEEKTNISREICKRFEKTVIHRIVISDGNIEYFAKGEVPGQVSNQFSLSEYEEHLRVSSTIWGNTISWLSFTSQRQNNIYVLNMNLEIVGSVEGLAPGESIYATRFIEDKCYLVTFRQIDPFFVIDLSDPLDPKLLGELKIPGYSTYLHPFDDKHIIGIGMDGSKVKISMFDVTNMSNPIELSVYEINDVEWGTSSALYEHKAFLFNREKNLLVIPAGTYSKESAYVFNITIENGIDLKGVISHDSENQKVSLDEYWNYDYGNSIKRTLYIGDVLYTISDNMVKMNSLDDLHEINCLTLN